MSETTRTTWEALAARCRKATGPDREIDLALARTIDAIVMRQRDDDTGADEYTYWIFTDLIDHIVSLIEKTLPGKAWEVASPYSWSGKNALSAADVGLNREYAKTPALALCAAYCMARAGMEDDAP